MPTALLTGAPTHAAAATALLERGGFSVLDGSPPPAPPVDCYLQLPAAGGAGRDLAARLDALVAVAARLDRRASVLLAVDDGDAGRAVSDELLVALAQVVLEDYGRPCSDERLGPIRCKIFPAVNGSPACSSGLSARRCGGDPRALGGGQTV